MGVEKAGGAGELALAHGDEGRVGLEELVGSEEATGDGIGIKGCRGGGEPGVELRFGLGGGAAVEAYSSISTGKGGTG